MGELFEITSDDPLRLQTLKERLAVCRIEPRAEFPGWVWGASFFSLTRTAEELSIVCPEQCVPAGVACEGGWRALKLEGPFDFGEVGVMVSVAEPLAEAGISIFTISTYDTDYVLVKEEQLERAASTLRERGHRIG